MAEKTMQEIAKEEVNEHYNTCEKLNNLRQREVIGRIENIEIDIKEIKQVTKDMPIMELLLKQQMESYEKQILVTEKLDNTLGEMNISMLNMGHTLENLSVNQGETSRDLEQTKNEVHAIKKRIAEVDNKGKIDIVEVTASGLKKGAIDGIAKWLLAGGVALSAGYAIFSLISTIVNNS